MAEHSIKLQPFRVPMYVFAEPKQAKRQDPFAEQPKFELAELSTEELDTLCREFRSAIFAKAGKTDPSTTQSEKDV